MGIEVAFTVNGEIRAGTAEPRTHLADYLREHHDLTGTHLGCEHGVCGACTIMVDGQPVRSCTNFASACNGSVITTIEGFDDDPLMAALRDAFKRHHALQCGYCTPGMLITAYDIVRRIATPDESRVRRELAGNLCRCTGYKGIVEAVLEVAAAHASEPFQIRCEPLPSPRPLAQTFGAPLPALPKVPSLSVSRDRLVERRGDVWHLHLGVPAETLWDWLHDTEAVMRCLPGATLTGTLEALGANEQQVPFSMAVAIGPMRTKFDGQGTVRFDESARRGELSGVGEDIANRTQAEGKMTFTVEGDDQAAVLVLGLRYQLKGDLAQYSRGGVVDAVTEQLLIRFAQNVGHAVAGEHFDEQSEVSGTALARAAFWQRLKKFFF